MGRIVFGAIMPHPPILAPEIGGPRLKQAHQSLSGCQQIVKLLKQANVDVIIIITPHGQISQTAVPIYTGRVFEGNFSNFGLAKPDYHFKGDAELALSLVKNCITSTSCSETLLDHGALVPLSFVQSAGITKPIVPLAIGFLPLPKLFEFGQQLSRAIARKQRKVGIIASADLSHRLTPDAPSGFNPRGKEFDEKLVSLVKANDVQGILNFDPLLAEAAGQDALWSIAILLGALDGLAARPEVLSYEGPFGVGYMTALWNIQ